MDLATLTIAEIQTLLAKREVRAREIAERQLARIEERNPEIKAFLSVTPEMALEQADAIDRKIEKGEPLPPLAGVPVAVKDVIVTKDIVSTAGSRMLENYRPPYDATVITKLKAAGAVIVGKTNCDEFAMGSSNENSAYFPARNPHDTERVPGGSSGGSAAAVAGGMAVTALGSDTGGSIRQPASLCGAVGMMGTYGRVSRYGLIAFASSLDHIGPFARTVKDAALMLQTIAGSDPLDSTAAEVPVPNYFEDIEKPVKGMKIGLPSEYFGEGLNPEVRAKVEKGIEKFRELGCQVREVPMPHTEYAIAVYYIVATAEASSNLARFDGVRYGFRAKESGTLDDLYFNTRGGGFGAEVKRRIMLGTYALSSGFYEAYYRKAQKVRTLISQDFVNAFKEVDALVTPTSPSTAFKLGEKLDDPLQMYLTDIYTVTGSLAGVPGISLPCGKDAKGLPVGLQIFTRHFDETRLLQLSHAFEQSGGFTV